MDNPDKPEHETEPDVTPPNPIVADGEKHTVFITGETLPTTDSDIVDEPHKLFAAEARVSGLSLSQWGRRLNAAVTDWLGPHGGLILLAAAILLWLWISYTR